MFAARGDGLCAAGAPVLWGGQVAVSRLVFVAHHLPAEPPFTGCVQGQWDHSSIIINPFLNEVFSAPSTESK